MVATDDAFWPIADAKLLDIACAPVFESTTEEAMLLSSAPEVDVEVALLLLVMLMLLLNIAVLILLIFVLLVDNVC